MKNLQEKIEDHFERFPRSIQEAEDLVGEIEGGIRALKLKLRFAKGLRRRAYKRELVQIEPRMNNLHRVRG